jgi:RND superfamily putative drug exporter
MSQFTAWILEHRRTVLVFWGVLLALSLPLSLRFADVAGGATEVIQGSPSDRANRALQRAFGEGAPFVVPVIVSTDGGAAALRDATEKLAVSLARAPEVHSARHFWNSGDALLRSGSGKSALLLVQTRACGIAEAENLTPALRRRIAEIALPAGTQIRLTGVAAMFHDLNRNAAEDLQKAEMVGVPLTLLILLAVFRSPLAAALPLLIALGASAVALAGLYVLSHALPASVFAQNAVTMIGLGTGVDYALFMLHRFRAELARGAAPARAVLRASASMGPALLASGFAVGIGFLALFLVDARFVHSVAIGGLLVVGCAVAMALTLLPILLVALGARLNWPYRTVAVTGDSAAWRGWARHVMRHAWLYLVAGLCILAALALPALRAQAWNVGAADLPSQIEARQGYEILQRDFAAGWMGPIAIVVEAAATVDLHQEAPRAALSATRERLLSDARVAGVGEAQLSADGRSAMLLAVPKLAPETAETMALTRALQADVGTALRGHVSQVHVAGASAMMLDFDAEMFGSLRRVIPAVLGTTALALMVFFRSLLVPLKALCANLVSVLCAYGFLVLVFQDGIGAALLGINPPGGINSFIVLMLFTILFGLSMDYEVFLLRAIQEEHERGACNEGAVRAGIARSGSLISSAAAIMACLFASFGFAELLATREFGLGLAAAVALDATLIRLIVIPAAMRLLGEANWWFPRRPAPLPGRRPA